MKRAPDRDIPDEASWVPESEPEDDFLAASAPRRLADVTQHQINIHERSPNAWWVVMAGGQWSFAQGLTAVRSVMAIFGHTPNVTVQPISLEAHGFERVRWAERGEG